MEKMGDKEKEIAEYKKKIKRLEDCMAGHPEQAEACFKVINYFNKKIDGVFTVPGEKYYINASSGKGTRKIDDGNLLFDAEAFKRRWPLS